MRMEPASIRPPRQNGKALSALIHPALTLWAMRYRWPFCAVGVSCAWARVWLFLGASRLSAQSPAGFWDATVTANRREVSFRMEFSGSGPDVQAPSSNGEYELTSTRGRFGNHRLVLDFDYYAGRQALYRGA